METTHQDIVTVSLAEMNDTYPLVELKTPQDLQRAQVELLGLEHLKIKSESKRRYPYESAACHLIGWVAPWRDSEAEIFKDDAYMSYEPGEIVGKWGLEKVYEPVLRGRRGAVRYGSRKLNDCWPRAQTSIVQQLFWRWPIMTSWRWFRCRPLT
ncbi:MAG: hypothetical protein ACYSO3_03265 [Planctomycetota bacterium]